MKVREINENPAWTFVLPDSIADWDAPSHWERERLASMQHHLKPGMTLYDVGTEHGWLSAVYGSFTGHEYMVLIEPSAEMWNNVRKTWVANDLRSPIACFQMFCGATPSSKTAPRVASWPECSDMFAEADECPAMAYKYLGAEGIQVTTIDQIAAATKQPPQAITIDVEGFELDVVKGAEKTLKRHHPLVWISVHPDLMARDAGVPDVQELFDFMTACGYGREYLGTDHEQHHFFAPFGYVAP